MVTARIETELSVHEPSRAWEATATTLAQVRAWAALGESELLEFKATTAERDGGMRSLCGMLNHRGGHVHLATLRTLGLVETTGFGRGARWKRL